MHRRKFTDRIGVSRIGREQIGLTAASTEILEALRTRAARLAHPVETAETGERRRLVRDPSERMLLHARKFEPGKRPCFMARQRYPVRRDHHEDRTPSVHTRL